MALITLALRLYRDGTQAPFDIEVAAPNSTNGINFKAIGAPAEEACWAPESLFRELRLFPTGFEQDEDGTLVPRYSVDVILGLEDSRRVKLERLRVYRDRGEIQHLALGGRVCDAVLRIPPS